MRRVIFVAGAHTEIGKTHVACGLLRAARDAGWSVDALKPVVSGFDERDWRDSDPGRLLAAMGRELTAPQLACLSPWRFAAPLAPPMAASIEGRDLPLAPVVEFCRRRIAESKARLIVAEGVGGLMSPIVERATSLDLLEALDAPCVLVGGAYLGALSHTLTALDVLRSRGRAPSAVLISEDAAPDAPDFAGTLALAAEHAGEVPVIAVPRADGHAWAVQALCALDLPIS
jgi:dethiobiotin synthetase